MRRNDTFKLIIPTLLSLITSLYTAWSFTAIRSSFTGIIFLALIVAQIVIWSLWYIQAYRPTLTRIIATPLHRLRQYRVVYWCLLLLSGSSLMFGWILIFNPVQGQFDPLEVVYVSYMLWGMWFLLTYGLNNTEQGEAQFFKNHFARVLSLITIALSLFFAIELGLRYAVVMTDNAAATLPSQRWFALNWSPINTLGYRDQELIESEETTSILITGDSFVAGHGVTFDETLAQQLRTHLPESYQVNIAAQGGWSTEQQIAALQQYPLQPDMLVLSYFINDIYPAAERNGYPPVPSIAAHSSVTWFTETFYVFNIPWYFSVRGALNTFYVDSRTAYTDPVIWAEHQAELDTLIAFAEETDAQFVALIWPFLSDIEASQPSAAQVEAYFSENGATTINLALLLEDYTLGELSASWMDSHPNGLAHSIASDALAQAILSLPNPTN